MRKEIEFALKFDSREFDRAIEQIKTKLKDIDQSAMTRMQYQTGNRLQQAGLGGGASIPTQEAFQRATMQMRGALDKSIASEVKEQEKLAKTLDKANQALKAKQELYKEHLKFVKEDLELKKEIERIETSIGKKKAEYQDRDRTVNAMLDAREKTSRPGGIAGIMDDYRTGGGKKVLAGMGGAGRVGGMIGGAAGGVAGLGALIEQLAGAPRRLEQARGSAIQNTYGRDLQDTFSGRSAFAAAWNPERAAAMSMAKKETEGQRTGDLLKLLGAGLGMAGGAALTASGVGAGIGIPLMMASGGAVLGSDRLRNRAMSGLSDTASANYEDILKAQQAQNFRQNLESKMQQDPNKKLSMEYMEQNYIKHLQTQRSLGLSDQGLTGPGGLLRTPGFFPEQLMGMAGSIVGAGGSARGGRMAGLGLQMERSGLTNAGGVLGTLSGAIQSPEATRRATISIMSEAFRIGLDNTDFAEENRRFTQAAAEVMARSGATSEADQGRVSQAMSKFMGERTNLGVEGARAAYEQFQERGSQLGGRRGVTRMSSAMSDPNLGKLPTDELTELLAMRPENMNENNPMIAYFAKQTGLTAKDLINKVSDLTGKTRFQVAGRAEKAAGFAKTINSFLETNKMSVPELFEKNKSGELSPEISQALGGLMTTTQSEEGGGYRSGYSEATAAEFLKGAGRAGGKGAAEAQLSGSERVGDELVKQNAAGVAEVISSLRDLTGDILKAAAAAREFSDSATSKARSGPAKAPEKEGWEMLMDWATAKTESAPVGGKATK